MTPSQSPDNPAALLGPKRILDAQESGRKAALEGRHISTCPWDTTTATHTALRAQWVRGYAAGRTELRRASPHPD